MSSRVCMRTSLVSNILLLGPVALTLLGSWFKRQNVSSTVDLLSQKLYLSKILLLLLLSRFSCVWLCVTPLMAAHQAPRPWDSPSKNTGVGCHFLLQCMKVKSESEVAQVCPTLSNPMDCSLPGSSVHGIFQARVLEWVPSPSPSKILGNSFPLKFER